MKTNIDIARECRAKATPTIVQEAAEAVPVAVFFQSDDQLDTFAERIRADEREHCAAIAEQMTARSRKIRAALNGVVAPDCPVAAAIRNL